MAARASPSARAPARARAPRLTPEQRITAFVAYGEYLERAYPADASKRRDALYKIFGVPEWHFLRDRPDVVRDWMVGVGALVPLASPGYAAAHAGPNAFQLRADYTELGARDGSSCRFQLADGARAEALLEHARGTFPHVGPNERMHVLWLAKRRRGARAVVAPLRVDDTLELAGANGALYTARLLVVNESSRYVIVALRERVPPLPPLPPASVPAGATAQAGPAGI